MYNWNISPLVLPLKFDWAISRNTSTEKENFLITVEKENFFGRGEVAFNVRYGESKKMILDQMEWFSSQKVESFQNWKDFDLWLGKQDNLCSSLKMGLSQAFVSLEAEIKGVPLAELMGFKLVESAITSFSIPLMDKNDLPSFLEEHRLLNYPTIKLKIKNNSSLNTLNSLLDHYQGKVRIDANEGFESAKEFLSFFEKIQAQNRIEFIEQPIPASKNMESKIIKEKIEIPLMADESITSQVDFNEISDCFDGVNIKLMKSGTLSNSIGQLRKAKELKMKTMIGCMIETSLSISFAYHLSGEVDFLDLDGFLLIKQDPFNFLNETEGLLTLHNP